MKYYQTELFFDEKPEVLQEHKEDRLSLQRGPVHCKLRTVNRTIEKYGSVIISEINEKSVVLGMVLEKIEKYDTVMSQFTKEFGLKLNLSHCEEITIDSLSDLLTSEGSIGTIRSINKLPVRNSIAKLIDSSQGGGVYREKIVEKITKTEAIRRAQSLSFGKTFTEEMERIYYQKPKKEWYGYPVRYVIEVSDEEIEDETKEILVSSLYANNRIQNPRYGSLNLREGRRWDGPLVSAVYECAKGCVIFVDMLDIVDSEEDDLVDGSLFVLENICFMAKEYADEVLTVFVLPGKCDSVCRKIYELMEMGAFVHIREEGQDYDTALTYLKRKAGKKKVHIDKRLLGYLDRDKKYYSNELNKIFAEWFDAKLRRSIYSQYSEMKSVKKDIAEKDAKGKAYDELEKMIGLKSAKKVVNDAISMHKAQKIFVSKGLQKNDMSMHMVFTGNPGTAKTTVARLFAQILKDNEIISSGRIVEVGRGDLVGKYVGWTAPTIKAKFKAASGGILFIDEAYSLVDDRDGSYGDEAINTIVQEMENHRRDVIVIFAGYPDKMEQFLDKNPGLRSRITFHVRFEDYSPEELCEIAELIAGKMGMKIDEGAKIKLHGIMEQASEQKDFGNGRFARNIIEKARMAQSTRLIGMDFDKLSVDDVATICAEDIEGMDYAPKKRNMIGFAS